MIEERDTVLAQYFRERPLGEAGYFGCITQGQPPLLVEVRGQQKLGLTGLKLDAVGKSEGDGLHDLKVGKAGGRGCAPVKPASLHHAGIAYAERGNFSSGYLAALT